MTRTRKPKPESRPPGALALAWEVFASPSRAALECAKEGRLRPALWIYGAFLLALCLFTTLKPPGFLGGSGAKPEAPAAAFAAPAEGRGFFHGLRVALWNSPLELALIVFLGATVSFLESGNLGLGTALGIVWAAWALGFVILYGVSHAIGKGAFLLATLAWLVPFYPLLRRVEPAQWLRLAAFMLALNAIGVALAVPMTAAALARSEEGFTAVQVVGALWLLGASTAGLRALTGLRLPRAFMAIFLASLFQTALLLAAHLLGAVPREILMAQFYL